MTLTLHMSHFRYLVPCSHEPVFHSCRVLCLQRQDAKLASELFYCLSLLRFNSMVSNLQKLTSSYGGKRFAACDCLDG